MSTCPAQDRCRSYREVTTKSMVQKQTSIEKPKKLDETKNCYVIRKAQTWIGLRPYLLHTAIIFCGFLLLGKVFFFHFLTIVI